MAVIVLRVVEAGADFVWLLENAARLQAAPGASGQAIEDVASALQGAYFYLFVLWMFVVFVCAMVFLVWFVDAHRNLKRGGIPDTTWSGVWIVLGFVIPLVNLVLPYLIMKEVWKGSQWLAGTVVRLSWRQVPNSWLVRSWWIFFVLHSCGTRASNRGFLRADEIGEMQLALLFTIGWAPISVLAALLAILLVHRITAAQTRAIERLRRPPETSSMNSA
ncbi:MAG: hypothetical protein KatS3mg060_0312 [Dehalococcoidia bacterium]|nr:MAG: hypothetical protein KatS3mg060_0312 [Dehalococcoidia bacterium]